MIGRLTERLRRGPVHVACAADEPWMPHCAAMLHSLLANAPRPVRVHLLAVDVGEELLPHLEGVVASAGGALAVHRVRGDDPALDGRVPAAAWARNLLPSLLEGVGRVLWLDCDVIVTGSLEEAWRAKPGKGDGVPLADAGELEAGAMLVDLVAGRAEALTGVPARHFDGSARMRPWHPLADPSDRELYWRHRGATPWADPSLTHPMRRFFNGLRHTRAERYAGRPPRRRTRGALLTIVHNEPVFLPIWLSYYSRFYAPEDIYVLDHGTDDGSTSQPGFNRIPVSREGHDAQQVLEVISEHERELLGRYTSLLVADSDEIIAPDPAFGTLGDYVARFDEEFVNCLGYEIIHLPDEPAIDPSRPVLEQRRFWFSNDGYDKPALVSTPIERVPGLHARADREMNLDPDLRLIHLHRLDYASCFARHRDRNADRSERDLKAGRGIHLATEGEEDFAHWFFERTAFDEYGIHLAIEPIPERWKGLV